MSVTTEDKPCSPRTGILGLPVSEGSTHCSHQEILGEGAKMESLVQATLLTDRHVTVWPLFMMVPMELG